MNNGNVNNNNKTNTNRVRAVASVPLSATSQVVYDITFSSIIVAWIDCERNKRSSNSCTKFRWHAARDLVELWQQMRQGEYEPLTSMVFIVTKPVLREVFTDWIIHVKKIDGFIIFVDDWRCLVRSLQEAKRLIAEVKEYLWNTLHITLHPDKVYIQHYTKGTKFVGAVIKPASKNHTKLSRIKVMHKWAIKGLSGCVNATKLKKYLLAGFKRLNTSTSANRIYISNRTRGQFISKMIAFNRQATSHANCVALLEQLRSSINSYLGLMCHYNSYKVRRRICEKYILPTWGKYIYFEDEFRVCIIRKEYDAKRLLRKRLKKRKFAARFIRPKWRPD